MTSTIDTIGTGIVPAAGRIGQATAVEQSRAVAEVQAAVIVAQRCPRNITEALRQMRDSCNRMALAERAFFRVPRGDKLVSRPSVHLARELARIWGNLDWGTAELRRDDDHKQSEMMAFAWDLQTNSRNRSTFIVPHRRDTKLGPKDLSTQQDIYENNANNGARRLREVIFATLPGWFTEEAQQICAKRISEGNGEPLDTRITNCVDRYSKISITLAQLEAKTGSKRADWTPNDLAQLAVVYQSILRNEISKDEEFPAAAARPTAADLTPARPAPDAPGPAAEPQRDAAAGVSPAGPGAASVPGPATQDESPGSGPEAGPGTSRPDPTQPASSSAARSNPPQETSPPSPSSPPSSAAEPADPAAAASPPQAASRPARNRRLTKPTLGRLTGTLASIPLGPDRPYALAVLVGRPEVKLPSDLYEDEAQTVLDIIEIETKAAPDGDNEEVAAAIWRRVRSIDSAGAEPAEVPTDG